MASYWYSIRSGTYYTLLSAGDDDANDPQNWFFNVSVEHAVAINSATCLTSVASDYREQFLTAYQNTRGAWRPINHVQAQAERDDEQANNSNDPGDGSSSHRSSGPESGGSGPRLVSNQNDRSGQQNTAAHHRLE